MYRSELARNHARLLVLLTALSAAVFAAEGLSTPAESAGFKATPSYDETLGFIRELSTRWPAIRVEEFGKSASGRPMFAVVVARDDALTPQTAQRSGRPILMIQNGIHAGEIDGKDACLMILRDMALGRHRDLLDNLILVIVPVYNVDGHERVSRFHRPNQNGPEAGMGFRTTTDGHDLNRDHLKLDTPEARALIGLFNRWKPHLHVDDHVTNGVDHDWVLTYSWVEGPQIAPSLDAWLARHMPAVRAATEAAGHRIGPYASLIDSSDPSQGLNTYVGEPRYATGYFPLRNVPSILVENHSYKPYRERVLANRSFLLALMQRVAAEPRQLLDAVAEARRRTVSLGRPDAEPSDVVLRYTVAEPTETIPFPVYDWYTPTSVVTGGSMLRYRSGQVREIEAPWAHRPRPEVAVRRPRGYLVPPGWPVIEERLVGHGLVTQRLRSPVELDVETIRISEPRQGRRSRPSYQGRTTLSVNVERRMERRSFPAGTLWIPADQPDFEVAVQLLEPEAPDSLLSWGLLSIVLERKEYIGPGVLEDLARSMLEDDAIKAAWALALEDESFAADRTARYTWWYRRTEYWDETVGLLPVMRLISAPPF